jgi:hypothetical protein
MEQEQKSYSYYSIFVNTMEAITTNFGAEDVKNVGDKVYFLFPKTSEPSLDKTPFKDALKKEMDDPEHNSMGQS